MGFTQSTVVRCLFHKEFADGSQIMLLDYVDDSLYFGTKVATVKQFEEQLSARFELELMGQAHWYLSTCITLLANFDITDQTRYCMSILKRYLETARCPNSTRHHPTPFALDFTPSADNYSTTEEEARTLSMEYNIDFASCVGSFWSQHSSLEVPKGQPKLRSYNLQWWKKIPYISITDGKQHYSKRTTICFLRLILEWWHWYWKKYRMLLDHFLHGREWLITAPTFLTLYVALSSAEAEYNETCLCGMAVTHLKMLLNDMEARPENEDTIYIILDSKSAIAMGNSFKDTKHTRHILRRYHYVRDGIEAKRFELIWINTKNQFADIGTKQTPGPRNEFLMHKILTKIGSVQEGWLCDCVTMWLWLAVMHNQYKCDTSVTRVIKVTQE